MNEPHPSIAPMTEAQAVWAKEQASNLRKIMVDRARASCPWVHLIHHEWLASSLNDPLSTLIHGEKRESDKQEGSPLPVVKRTEKDSSPRLTWTKKIREYLLERASVESPYLEVEGETLHAFEAMECSSLWVFKRRYQELFERISGRLVICGNHNSNVNSFGYKDVLEGMKTPWRAGGFSGSTVEGIHCRLAIENCKEDGYGEESGKPIFAFIGGDDTIPHLGGRLSGLFFRKFIGDPPRYRDQDGTLARVEQLTSDGSYNFAYDDAQFEAAYIFSKAAMSVQIPKPKWVTDERPEDCLVDVEWINKAPGFFLATFASAGVPLRVEQGYTILFRRR